MWDLRRRKPSEERKRAERRGYIKNAGAKFLGEKVVEDRNLVTSRQPGDLPEFIAACLAGLQ